MKGSKALVLVAGMGPAVHAGDRGHAVADHEDPGGHVPFELAQARDLQGALQAEMLFRTAKVT